MYGSANGLVASGGTHWTQDSAGVAGAAETSDHFGWAVAAGDFDGDGISDLAIGIPDESTGSVADEGGVQILRGTRTGLAAWRYWNILSASGGNTDRLCDCRFGAALAAGDFDGDGRDDLAIGMPNKDLMGSVEEGFPILYPNTGAVAVITGGANGLSTFRFRLLAKGNGDSPIYQRHELPGTRGILEALFGAGLAAGDFDGDGRDDLAIGEPEAERAYLVRGSATGIDPGAFDELWPSEFSPNGTPMMQFGRALAMGDVDGDGTDEVFAGAPLADPGGVTDAGAVFEYHSDGLRREHTQASIPGVAAEAGDRFGWAVASGDFDRNGRADLAIGAPNEDIGSKADAGAVTVLRSFGALDTQSAKTWTQANAGIPGGAEAGDRFGASLSAANFGKGAFADLAIGVPLEDFTAGGVTRANAGVIDVLYGTRLDGLATAGAQDWSQATTGIPGGFETNDQFGYALGR
ncbi:MAG: FG-GAP repeat protein, partial [Actinomycetota bacterium]